MTPIDAIALAQALIRCPSVTPEDHGALETLQNGLAPLGFSFHRLRFEDAKSSPVENLYARIGTGAPHFCFAGHTDVVPVGDRNLWRHDPFGAVIENGILFGRGASDMKSAIGAFAAAASNYLGNHSLEGSISLLITGDEEGVGVNGTSKMLDWLKQHGEVIDHCLVGEPTSSAKSGDVIKIGRRGSMNFIVTVKGIGGHAAYPHLALNPVPIAAEFVGRIAGLKLDDGSEWFEPSTLAFTMIDAGNRAVNVIPQQVRAGFNIRFNDRQTPDALLQQIAQIADEVKRTFGGEVTVESAVSGVSFVTKPGKFTDLLSKAVAGVNGAPPEFSTSGGTSDARFIKDYCPVAELGLPGKTMHKLDESVAVEDITRLARIYESVLDLYFTAR
ncbi:MAG TPA: succinyl-diaminopimelate desuccinylase [Micropepsaceae bacterium]|nr:succinyl-diaminopimelate desuccinylase [Micropepsaceae bacterium]